jgi:DNA-binding winged helix-turn-helix (wHTH) protein
MAREFQVGEWLIEPDLNRINKAGRITSVEPKVLEVLVCLAHHPGEVLSKEQIVKIVWPDTYVGEGTLSYSISELRKAFCDDAKDPRIIETIPRKGYRLIAPVAHLAPTFKSQPSIAVLPFADISSEKDQEYFCDGIAEEIINNLARSKACGSPRAPPRSPSRANPRICAPSAKRWVSMRCWRAVSARLQTSCGLLPSWSMQAMAINCGQSATTGN